MPTWTSNTYDGRYLQLSISETVNVAANTSTLNWTLTSAGGASAYYTIDATNVSINGVSVYSKARTAWDDRVFPAAKGSVSGSTTVAHNADGTKSITIVFSTRVYVFGPVDYGGTMTLTSIDRTAPTVSFTSSNITASGFKISATSSATADIWQYSTNNGTSWTQFSTTAGTSASITISNLSPNTTYNVKVRARKKSNQVYGTSGASAIKTLGGAVVNSATAVTADAATVSLKLNVTVYEVSYTNTLVLKNGSSTYLTISGLSWSKGTADRTITLTADQRTTLLSAMSSIKSFTGTFAVSTYSGTTQIGTTSSQTATVQTTTASAPTLSGFTFADSSSTTTAITGNNQVFIQNHSTLRVTPGAATAKNGASITNYTATCNGISVSNTSGSALSVGAVSKSGSVAVVLTVTDSRGYTASISQNITVVAYANPKVSAITLRRTNDIEAEMQLTFNGSISAVSVGGTQKNALKYVRYQYKLTSATSYGSYVSILSSVSANGTSFSYSNLELCNLASNASYDFHLQIRDKLDSTTSLDLYFVVPQGTPLVALRKGKVGINTPSPTEALHVVGNAKVSGTLTAETLSGLLASSNLSSAVPIAKGGTGATTAASARTNLGALSTSGGTITGQISRGNNASSWINGRSNAPFRVTANSTSSSFFPVMSAKSLSGSWEIGALGNNLYFSYATDVNFNAGTNTTTTCNINTSGNFSGKAANVTGTVAIANGGTGATSAASARSNLGITCTSLYNGSLTSGSITFNYGNYNAYVILGKPGTASAISSLIIPKGAITTSAVKYQFTDESYYRCILISYSGSTVTLTIDSGSGPLLRVLGIT